MGIKDSNFYINTAPLVVLKHCMTLVKIPDSWWFVCLIFKLIDVPYVHTHTKSKFVNEGERRVGITELIYLCC